MLKLYQKIVKSQITAGFFLCLIVRRKNERKHLCEAGGWKI